MGLSETKSNTIALTFFGVLMGTCFVVGTIILLVQKNTFIARRKASMYMAIATIGLIFYIRDTLNIVWPSEKETLRASTYMYYLIAVPFHFIPVMVRSWRIYCVYRPTMNWRCEVDSIAVYRRRGHPWMLLRMLALYIPFALLSIGIQFYPTHFVYTFVALNGVYAIVNFALTVTLWKMRAELKEKFLDESNTLLIYSIFSLLEWLWYAEFLWAKKTLNLKGIIAYMYVEFFWIALMWSLTVGRTVWNVLTKRDISQDKKPELTDADIQRAKKSIEEEGSRNSSGTSESNLMESTPKSESQISVNVMSDSTTPKESDIATGIIVT